MTPLGKWLDRRLPPTVSAAVLCIIYMLAVFLCLVLAGYYGGVPIIYLDIGQ